MKYGALKFTSTNIGDEIQSIAAQRFLPKVDYYIFREQLSKFSTDEKVKLIMNSWYMWKPQNFPPQDCIEPLLISMFFNPDCRKKILTNKTISFFINNGPVGCRDLSTLKWLEENNIPAYFSGCLTTTLIPNERIRRKYPGKYILCVDCSDDVVNYVKSKSNYPVYSFTKHLSPYIESIDRMDLAKAVLFLYHNAYCVITPNLHTALPCLAFDTRVCLLYKKKEESHGVGRFEGMESFFNWQSEEILLNGGYDINNPVPNPKDFEKLRDDLVSKCIDFTGYDSNRPTLDDDFDPLPIIISMIGFNNNNLRRSLYYTSRKDLLKSLYFRFIRNLSYLDIDGEDYLTFRK